MYTIKNLNSFRILKLHSEVLDQEYFSLKKIWMYVCTSFVQFGQIYIHNRTCIYRTKFPINKKTLIHSIHPGLTISEESFITSRVKQQTVCYPHECNNSNRKQCQRRTGAGIRWTHVSSLQQQVFVIVVTWLSIGNEARNSVRGNVSIQKETFATVFDPARIQYQH